MVKITKIPSISIFFCSRFASLVDHKETVQWTLLSSRAHQLSRSGQQERQLGLCPGSGHGSLPSGHVRRRKPVPARHFLVRQQPYTRARRYTDIWKVNNCLLLNSFLYISHIHRLKKLTNRSTVLNSSRRMVLWI